MSVGPRPLAEGADASGFALSLRRTSQEAKPEGGAGQTRAIEAWWRPSTDGSGWAGLAWAEETAVAAGRISPAAAIAVKSTRRTCAPSGRTRPRRRVRG